MSNKFYTIMILIFLIQLIVHLFINENAILFLSAEGSLNLIPVSVPLIGVFKNKAILR